jgi:hypothetical protein
MVNHAYGRGAMKVQSTLLYATGTPVRWLRSAIAAIDEQLVMVCREQWQRAVVPRAPRATMVRRATRQYP